MRVFGKGDGRIVQHPVTAFWTWWAEVGRAIEPSGTSGLNDELTRLIGAIHPELTWHFGKGATAQRRLTVSAGGLADARPSAERWLRAAPNTDSTWEFRSSKAADPDALTNTLEIAGAKLDLRATRFRVEPVERRLKVHVGVHHPRFATLPKQARGQVSFLVLDWLLGEDDVERWIGEVEPLREAPESSGTATDVQAAVAKTAAQRNPETWMLANGTNKRGRPFLATWRRGVRWLDAPIFDRHQSVAAKYRAQSNGLPADRSILPELGKLETELEEIINGRGLLVAITMRDGVRTFHAYTDGEDQNVDAAIADWARTRHLKVTAKRDPAWTAVRVFTG